VFPVRYGLNFYILFRRNSVFKGLRALYSDTPNFRRNCFFHLQGSWEVLPKRCCLSTELNSVTLQNAVYLVTSLQQKFSQYRSLNFSTLFLSLLRTFSPFPRPLPYHYVSCYSYFFSFLPFLIYLVVLHTLTRKQLLWTI
jgi:hypothetical protein